MSAGAALDELSDTGGEGWRGLRGETTKNRVIPEAGKGRDHGGSLGKLPAQPGPSKCLGVPAVGEDTDGPQGRECQKEIQGFSSSPWSREFPAPPALSPAFPALPALSRRPSQGNSRSLKGGYFKGQK